MMTGESCNIERQVCPRARRDHRGQAASKRITQFQKAVRSCTSYIGKHNATTMELGEYLLIDPRVLIALSSVNDDQAITQFVFENGFRHDIEEILHVCVVLMVWIK